MKKTRITAMFLCLTMLFALFTGGVYAEDGVIYIDETTLVIEDGKLISGDKSLIDNGYIVIGDDEVDGGTGEDTRHEEIKPEDNTNGFTEDYSAPKEEGFAQSGKAPVKDNTNLTKPDTAPEQTVTPSVPETILPGETPSAVNPNVPEESARAQAATRSANLGYDTTTSTSQPLDYNPLYVYATQKVERKNATISTFRYYTQNKDSSGNAGPCVMYRYHPSGENVFKGVMIQADSNKTFTLDGSSTNPITVDGRESPWGATASTSNITVSNPLVKANGSGAKVVMDYVTLRKADSSANGAGLYITNGATAELTNCTIDDCDTSANGGGIYVASGGTLKMTTVTIKNCKAAKGGAIYVAGKATLTFSGVTITKNDATEGGGLYNAAGANTLNATGNLTFGGGAHDDTKNTATRGGNIYVESGSLTTNTNCTINNGDATYGGGVYVNTGTFTFSGGVIGWNQARHGGGVYVDNGTFKMTAGNLNNNTAKKTDEGAGGAIRTPDSLTDDGEYRGNINISGGNIFSNSSNANGGAMWIGSVKSFKISGGNIYSNSSNSRGGAMFFNRPTETPIEITGDTGVVNIYSNTAVLSGGGIVIGNYKGPISAVIGSAGTVTNRVSIYSNKVTGGSVSDDETTGVINDGIGGGIHFMDDEAGDITITIRHADIYGNTATFYGGGMYVGGETKLTMTDGLIGSNAISTGNNADYGGGIAMEVGASFTMNGGSISYNSADQHGGGIYSVGQANLNIRGGTISYNEAGENGGGIYAAGTNANGIRIVGEVYNIYIHHNKSKTTGSGGGGGLCFSNHTDSEEKTPHPLTGVVIGGGSLNVNIYDNTAIYGGGIRFLNSGYGLISVEIKGNVNIYSNDATASGSSTYKGGGGIFVGGNSQLVIDGADIYENTAASGIGAGVLSANGDITFKSGNIRNHTVADYGAGVELMVGGDFIMEGGYIKDNAADDGAGIHMADKCVVDLRGGTISNNTAAIRGGGIAQGGGTLTVSGATIIDNSARTGGGVYCNGGSLTLSGGAITSNDATYGGGIHVDENTDKTKTVVFSGGTINENTAVNNGAGVWIGEFESFTMNNTVIDGNHAGRIGGGMFFNRQVEEGTLLIQSGTVSNNRTDDPDTAVNATATSQFLAGGIYIGNGGDSTLSCYAILGGGDAPLNIYGNTSPRGGGLCVDDGKGATVTVILNSGVNIYGNSATDTIESGMGGGGIFISPSGYVVMNEGVTVGGTSRENGNTAKYGAGVQINGGTFIQNGGSIQYNTATYYAGGVYVIGTTFVMSGGTNKGNYAQEMGGGVYVSSDGAFELSGDSMFTENMANYGGGVYVKGTFTMSSGSIGTVDVESNLANFGGGVCVAENAVAVMSGGAIQNNVPLEGSAFEMMFGGGVAVFGSFTMTGGEIMGNQATGLGGGIIIDEHNDNNTPTASFVMTGGSVSNNYCSSANDAGNGGGIWVGTCKTFKIEGTGTNNPVISGNGTAGTDGDESGAGIYINRSVDNEIVIKNCSITSNVCFGTNSKGGGLCMSNSGLVKNNTVKLENVIFDGNKAGNGAGIFVNNGNANSYGITFSSFKDLTVTNNQAENGDGGGIYLSKITTNASGLTVTGNSAVADGGGIALWTNSALTLSGANTINENTSNRYGGGVIVRVGTSLTVTGTAEANTTIDGNQVISAGTGGGGVHVAGGGTFNMTYGSISGNLATVDANGNASDSHGGGVDSTGGTFSLTNVTLNGNKVGGVGGGIHAGYLSGPSTISVTNCTVTDNEAGTHGGGIILKGTGSTGTVTGCTISGNKALNGAGGGITVADAAVLTATNTFVTGNSAEGTFEGTTNYQIGEAKGTGGAVAVYDNGSSFTLTSGGIYNNTATTAGDDVFAAGNGTKLNLPASENLDLSRFVKENPDDVYAWVEDYMNGDTSYTSGLNGSNGRIVMRYKDTPASVRAFVTDAEGTSLSGRYTNDDDMFTAITFGVPKYNVGSVTITAPQSDDPNQRFVFTLSGVNSLGETINITVSALGGQTVEITELISGTYTIIQKENWSWRYEFDTVKADGEPESGENTVTVTITGTELEEVHRVEYENEKTSNKWLSHNSVGKVNIPPSTTEDSPVQTAYLIPETKRNYTV